MRRKEIGRTVGFGSRKGIGGSLPRRKAGTAKQPQAAPYMQACSGRMVKHEEIGSRLRSQGRFPVRCADGEYVGVLDRSVARKAKGMRRLAFLRRKRHGN